MADVASLSFAIDSSDSRRAKTDLDALRISASEVAEAQVKVNKAIAEGRDPIRALRSELELFQRDTSNAQRSIEGLVGRLNELTQSLASGSGNMRELRQMVGQIEAAATAFNTTAVGMEMFVRTSRNIGISSAETSQGLARITAALRDVSDEGERARRVLRDYGVSTDGRANDPAAVLREFTERLRSYRMDGRGGQDIQSVFGPMSTAGIAALLDPEYRTIAQRQREVSGDAEAQRIAELRNGLVASRRDRELRAAELADLEREYGYNDYGPRIFQSDAARRRELEARRDAGAQSRSQYERSDAFITDPIQTGYRYGGAFGLAIGGAMSGYRATERGLRWLGSDEFALRSETIGEDFQRELAAAGGLGGQISVFGRGVYRQAANLFGAGEVTPYRDTRPVNERTGAFNAQTDSLAFQGSLLPATATRQRMMLEAAQAFGVENIEELRGLLPEDILGRLSPGQRGAVLRREATMFESGMFDLARSRETRARQGDIARGGSSAIMRGDGGTYGLEGFAGGFGGTEREAERAERVAAIIVQAEQRIGDARRAGIRIREEVAELDAEIDRRRARTADELARQISDAEAEIGILQNGGSAESAGAQLRRRRAMRASDRSGVAEAALLQRDFAAEEQQVQQRLFAARRQGEQQEYLLGALRRGDDPLATGDNMRVNADLAGMREAARAMAEAGQQGTAEYGRMLEKIQAVETSLRAQLAAERERTREIGAQNTLRQFAASSREELVQQGDRTISERGARDARRRLALAEREAPAGADRNEFADNELARDPDFAARIEARRLTEMRQQAERDRLAREERLRDAQTGGSGDPVVQRQVARIRRMQALRDRMGDDPGLALEEQILQAGWATEDGDRRNAPIVGANQRAEVARARAGAGYRGIQLSERDLDAGARTILTEESNTQARLGVAATILNRVLGGNYGGSTVSDVVRAPGQFEVWQRGQAQAIRPDDPRLAQARQMLIDLVQGSAADPTGGATFFYGRDEMARRGTLQNHRWAVNPDGSPRSGVDIGGTRFLTAPGGAGGAAAARARLYGVDAEIEGATAAYLQDNPNADAGAFRAATVQQRVAESMDRFNQSTDRATLQMEALSRAGLTPFQQGLAAAIDQVRPLTENLRRLANRPETTQEQRGALIGQAQALEDQQRDLYIEGLRARDAAEARAQQNEIGDLRFAARPEYWFSSRTLQRDLAERRLRRDLADTRPNLSADEVEERVNRQRELAGLREQDRTLGMLRDGWYQLGNAAGAALERIIMQGGKATDVMKALVSELAAYWLRAGVRAVGGAAMDFAGTAVKAIGTFLAGTPTAAQGLVLEDRAWARPMAQGGVYAHAQYVPMANGGAALVGEAGPEAAVPLVRLPSGNLGVRTGGAGGGGGGSVFNINITTEGSSGNAAADAAFAEKMGKTIQANLRALMLEEMRRQQQPGGQLGGGGAPIYG